MPSLSILVPAYNEQYLVAGSLRRLEVLQGSDLLDRVQVIVVDDCSRDQTDETLRSFASNRGLTWYEEGRIEKGVELKGHGKRGKFEWVFLRHVLNGGKGAAIRSALAEADCDITVIHDADLEYNPRDLHRIVRVFVEERADAVFGSRFAGGEARFHAVLEDESPAHQQDQRVNHSPDPPHGRSDEALLEIAAHQLEQETTPFHQVPQK